MSFNIWESSITTLTTIADGSSTDSFSKVPFFKESRHDLFEERRDADFEVDEKCARHPSKQVEYWDHRRRAFLCCKCHLTNDSDKQDILVIEDALRFELRRFSSLGLPALRELGQQCEEMTRLALLAAKEPDLCDRATVSGVGKCLKHVAAAVKALSSTVEALPDVVIGSPLIAEPSPSAPLASNPSAEPLACGTKAKEPSVSEQPSLSHSSLQQPGESLLTQGPPLLPAPALVKVIRNDPMRPLPKSQQQRLELSSLPVTTISGSQSRGMSPVCVSDTSPLSAGEQPAAPVATVVPPPVAGPCPIPQKSNRALKREKLLSFRPTSVQPSLMLSQESTSETVLCDPSKMPVPQPAPIHGADHVISSVEIGDKSSADNDAERRDRGTASAIVPPASSAIVPPAFSSQNLFDIIGEEFDEPLQIVEGVVLKCFPSYKSLLFHASSDVDWNGESLHAAKAVLAGLKASLCCDIYSNSSALKVHEHNTALIDALKPRVSISRSFDNLSDRLGNFAAAVAVVMVRSAFWSEEANRDLIGGFLAANKLLPQFSFLHFAVVSDIWGRQAPPDRIAVKELLARLVQSGTDEPLALVKGFHLLDLHVALMDAPRAERWAELIASQLEQGDQSVRERCECLTALQNSRYFAVRGEYWHADSWLSRANREGPLAVSTVSAEILKAHAEALLCAGRVDDVLKLCPTNVASRSHWIFFRPLLVCFVLASLAKRDGTERASKFLVKKSLSTTGDNDLGILLLRLYSNSTNIAASVVIRKLLESSLSPETLMLVKMHDINSFYSSNPENPLANENLTPTLLALIGDVEGMWPRLCPDPECIVFTDPRLKVINFQFHEQVKRLQHYCAASHGESTVRTLAEVEEILDFDHCLHLHPTGAVEYHRYRQAAAPFEAEGKSIVSLLTETVLAGPNAPSHLVSFTFQLTTGECAELCALVLTPDIANSEGVRVTSRKWPLSPHALMVLFGESALMKLVGAEIPAGGCEFSEIDACPAGWFRLLADVRQAKIEEAEFWDRISTELDFCLEVCYDTFVRPIQDALGLPEVTNAYASTIKRRRAIGASTKVMILGRGLVDLLPFHIFRESVSGMSLIEMFTLSKFPSLAMYAYALLNERKAVRDSVHVNKKKREPERPLPAVIVTCCTEGSDSAPGKLREVCPAGTTTTCITVPASCHNDLAPGLGPEVAEPVGSVISSVAASIESADFEAPLSVEKQLCDTIGRSGSKAPLVVDINFSYLKREHQWVGSLIHQSSCVATAKSIAVNWNLTQCPLVVCTRGGVTRVDNPLNTSESRIPLYRSFFLAGSQRTLIPWYACDRADDKAMLVVKSALATVRPNGSPGISSAVREVTLSLKDSGLPTQVWSAFEFRGLL